MISAIHPDAAPLAEKPWLASYPPGVPAEVDVSVFSSIVDVYDRSIRQYRHAPAFANMGTCLTYGELDHRVTQLAAFLQQDLSLQPGERIALMMPNLLQYPVAVFAALRAGLTVTSVNPLYTPRELEYQLVDSEARAIILLENFAHILQRVLPATHIETVITTRVGDLLTFPKSTLVNFAVKYLKRRVPTYKLPNRIGFRQALRKGAKRVFTSVALQQSDLAFIQYTAGTTGLAKGVMLSHGNMVANLQQVSAWLQPFITEGREIIVTPLPLYHIFSLTANCLLFMKIGGLNHLITNPRDRRNFVKALKGLQFTAITGVNTLYKALLDTPGFEKLDFSALKLPIGGGMAVERTVARHWREMTGTTLIEAYGLTEASPGISINPINLTSFNGMVGLPLPSTECSIRNEAGQLVPAGATGEICVRGPQVMQGYWRRPDASAAALDADGWLHTGDLGVLNEEGFLKVVERKDDMIIVSGFNVYPSEIETVVSRHPGVAEVVAVGMANEHSGEVVKIVVVKKDPDLSKDELDDYCRRQLTGFKVPKEIEFRTSLPRSHIGKILRSNLRE